MVYIHMVRVQYIAIHPFTHTFIQCIYGEYFLSNVELKNFKANSYMGL